jgi:kinesin family protein 1
MIRMTNLKNLNEWLWDVGKFMNRKYMMQDHYQKFLDGEEFILRLRKEEDPFWEPPEDLFIGLSNFFLQSLIYCMDFEDKAYISDYKVRQENIKSLSKKKSI